MFIVLGYDTENFNRIIVMSQHRFTTKAAAKEYADTCAEGWHAFVVKEC